MVITAKVAAGITTVASKYVGQRVTEKGFLTLCNLLCMSECYFINTISASFILHLVSFCRMFKELLETFITALHFSCSL